MCAVKTRTAATAIATIVLAYLLSLALVKGLSLALDTELPLAVVSSWSMEPVLHIGDMIVLRGGAPGVGDIVVYYRGKYVVHRVVSVRKDAGIVEVETKGDANMASDGYVKLDRVKGVVVVVVPYIGVIKLAVDRALSATALPQAEGAN